MSSRVDGLVAHAMEMLERLAVNKAGKGMRCFGNPRGEDAANLVEQPLTELRIDPRRHARGGQFRVGICKRKRDDVVVGDR